MREHLCPVMLFSGKGGVGKTTLAAATAVRLANSGSRVLVVSTDPAHSLADVFDTELCAQPRTIAPGLDAMEVDAEAMLSTVLPGGQDLDKPGGGLQRLLSYATQTPGIDEYGAIEVLLQALEDAEHDVVILDTAPTGHTLRLLMLPDLLDGWLGTLMQLRQRIASAGRLVRRFFPGAPTDEATAEFHKGLQGGKERIGRLRAVLADPDRAQIFLVTIPEPMSVLETLRTRDLLRKQSLALGAIIVNQLQPDSPNCTHCGRRRSLHLSALEDLRQQIGDTPLRLVEAWSHDVRGCAGLADVAEKLWAT